MKKWLKILIISISCVLCTCAIIFPIIYLVNPILLGVDIINKLPNIVSDPEKPNEKIPLPTLNSVKNKYDIKQFDIDINNTFSNSNYVNPIISGSNIYQINIDNNFINKNFNEQTQTLHINIDPTLSNKDDFIYVNFKINNNLNINLLNTINKIIINVKKIPEKFLANNFRKKIIFDLITNSTFKYFNNVNTFAIYEQEQSSFKAPSNYVLIDSNSLPINISNLYLDASFFLDFDIKYNNYPLAFKYQPNFTNYTNLKKFIFDLNANGCFSFEWWLWYVCLFWNLNVNFINNKNIEIYSTCSLNFESFNQLNEYIANNNFMKLNPHYSGYKIPYYLQYINPLINNKDLSPTFSIPNDTNGNVFKVFEWDKYFLIHKKMNYFATNIINDKLLSIANIKLDFPWQK